MNETDIKKRDRARDIGAELLEAVRQMKAGEWARKTMFEPQSDGSIIRRVIRRKDGNEWMESETRIVGWQADLMVARMNSGLSQEAFSSRLGISRRTLEKWEQGRTRPSGSARILLKIAAKTPEAVLAAA